MIEALELKSMSIIEEEQKESHEQALKEAQIVQKKVEGEVKQLYDLMEGRITNTKILAKDLRAKVDLIINGINPINSENISSLGTYVDSFEFQVNEVRQIKGAMRELTGRIFDMHDGVELGKIEIGIIPPITKIDEHSNTTDS